MTNSARYTRTWEGSLPVGIPVDRPTRDTARRLAAAQGVGVSQYVAALIEQDAASQGFLDPVNGCDQTMLDDEQSADVRP